MALVLDGTNGVSLVQDGVVTAADLAGDISLGKVLQVVEGSTSSTVTVTTTTYTDTGLSVAITPSSTSSKILVFFQQWLELSRSGDGVAARMILYRDSTAIGTYAGETPKVEAQGSTVTKLAGTYPFIKLDSPATTSEVTYKLQGRPEATSLSGQVKFSTRPSIAIAVEIAG